MPEDLRFGINGKHNGPVNGLLARRRILSNQDAALKLTLDRSDLPRHVIGRVARSYEHSFVLRLFTGREVTLSFECVEAWEAI